jgi:hypothetical protein
MKFKEFIENFEESTIRINTSRGNETYSVRNLANYAQKSVGAKSVSIKWLKANVNGSGKNALNYPPSEGEDHIRSGNADLSFPIIVVIEPRETWIGDGNHRIYKAIHIAKQTHIPAYMIDASTLPPPDDI